MERSIDDILFSTKIDMTSRYPKNWKIIAYTIKEAAEWKCSKCGIQCFKPKEDVSKFSVKERKARTLQVHHSDYDPTNSDPNNLRPLCSSCHLSYHQGKRGNISPGQLSLFLLN